MRKSQRKKRNKTKWDGLKEAPGVAAHPCTREAAAEAGAEPGQGQQ